jgi:tetratricopeptide (TPR) repeat protein
MDKTMQEMENGRLAFLNGEFAEAAERYTAVLQTQTLSEAMRIKAITGQLESLIELDHLDEAHKLLEQYLQESQRPDRRARKAALLHVKAKYLKQSGDPKAAVQALRKQLTYISSQNERYYMRLTENYLQQARVFLYMDELVEARVYLDLATYYMQTDGDDLLKGYYYYYEAKYLLANKQKDEAELFFHSAREQFLRSGARWWAGKVDKFLSHLSE